MRFSVNVSMLFGELPFLDRFAAAASAGFAAVELWWPAGVPTDDLVAAIEASGVVVALMNFDAGSIEDGERGYVNDPARTREFRAHVPAALDLAERIGRPRLNALAGNALPGRSHADQLATARANIAFAASAAAARGLSVVVEPVNAIENPGYLLPQTDACVEFVRAIGPAPVRLQYDLYHASLAGDDLCDTLRAVLPYLGHVQIADAPGRGEPGTGDIAFPDVLHDIDRLGYNGYVGLEYQPAADSAAAFDWIEDWGFRRGSGSPC